ncbi:MAG TPA: hypothetical protein VG222_10620 [Vicinamibacterales bacterium]|nr:hypothetical protein [Vicinamibacterales bacterium]
MSDLENEPYDLTDIRPVLYIFGVAMTFMGIAGLIALGVSAVFTWFLLAGGLILLATGLFAERILKIVAGMPDDETQEEAHDDALSARKAS